MRRVIYAVNAALPASPSVKASPDGPGAGSAEQRRYVREVFSAIAPTYDLLNHVLSVNVDRSWRERAVARPGFRGSVVGAAFALPMLRRGVPRPDPGGPPKPQPKPLRAPVPPRPQPHPVRRPTPNRRGR